MSDVCKNWSQWLNKTRFSHLSEEQKVQTLNWLIAVRDVVLAKADIKEGQKIIDIGTGTGLLGFGVLEHFEDKVDLIFSDKFQDCLDECKTLLDDTKIKHRASFLLSDCTDIKLPDKSVDKALIRSVLVHVLDKQAAINEIYRILKPGGELIGFEPIINTNTKYWELTEPSQITDWEEFKNAEDDFMSASDNPMTNFNQDTLAKNLEDAGFSDGVIDVDTAVSKYSVNKDTIHNWLVTRPSPDEPNVYERFLKYFPNERVDRYCAELKEALDGKEVEIKTNTVFIKAIK